MLTSSTLSTTTTSAITVDTHSITHHGSWRSLQENSDQLSKKVNNKRRKSLSKRSLEFHAKDKKDGKHIQRHKERVRINVSGRIFESYKSTLVSKEGSIFGSTRILDHYDENKMEFFFDKDPHAFEAILVYLQCGLLLQPEKVTLKIFIETLQFFGFDKKASQIYHKESVKPLSVNFKYGTREQLGLRMYLFYLLEYPDINFISRFIAAFTTLVIFLSICVYCVESLPSMTANSLHSLYVTETFCVAWFTIELLTRFLLSPHKCQFTKSFLNWVDFLSIIPFYMQLMLKSEDTDTNVIGIAMLRVLRIARVFRVFKLSRYSKAIFLIIITIRSSIRELLLLLMFILILMVLFAAGIYHVENDFSDEDNKFKSIPHTFWLVIVTITTVGYGDMFPVTPEGQLITSILTVTGVVVVALPIPIIVNNFTRFYERIMSQSQKYQFDFEETKASNGEQSNEDVPLIVAQYETTM